MQEIIADFKKAKAAARRQRSSGDDRDDDRDHVITLQAGKLHDHASRAEAILIAAGVPFYVRDGSIVRPIIEEVPAFRGRKTKAVRLRQVTADMLRDQLSRAATFQKYNGRAKKFVEVDPPHDIADILLARDGDWLFPPLAGVITTPTMRPDGSILSEAGYDPITKLLMVAPPVMPPIPEQPSRDQALAALAQLDALLDEFPFVNTASRSVALSALMTPVVRGAMRVVPFHAADGRKLAVAKAICSTSPRRSPPAKSRPPSPPAATRKKPRSASSPS